MVKCPECGATMTYEGYTFDEETNELEGTWYCHSCGHDDSLTL